MELQRVSAFSILSGNSFAPAGSDTWTHLNSQLRAVPEQITATPETTSSVATTASSVATTVTTPTTVITVTPQVIGV